jgi:hypothetical protein
VAHERKMALMQRAHCRNERDLPDFRPKARGRAIENRKRPGDDWLMRHRQLSHRTSPAEPVRMRQAPLVSS